MPPADSQLLFLGTGTSVGVPVIGCHCQVCLSDDLRNKRTRSSIVLSVGELVVLVDSGTDLRSQALRENLSKVDAVIYTHSHLDHVAGFDELRAFCWTRESPLPLHATPDCLAALRLMFGWAFDSGNTYSGYVKPDPREIHGPFHIKDLTVTPLPVLHGKVTTIGLRFDLPSGFSFAYLPDVKFIPESTFPLLRNLDLLVIDSLREKSHSTHLSLAESLALSVLIAPRHTLFTHLSHEFDHSTLSAKLPSNVALAYDGLKIPLLS